MPGFTLIYGSETGQSESIAEQIYNSSLTLGLDANLSCANQLKSEDLHNTAVVFVVSSTGDGDPPENFESFWNSLQDNPPHNLKYTLLGLGDTNYSSFGGFPTQLDEFLTQRGGEQFYKFEVADDAVGLEMVVEPWIEGLWEPLGKVVSTLGLGNDIIQCFNRLKIDCPKPENQKPSKLTYQIIFTEDKFVEKFPYGVKDFILPFSCGELEEASVSGKKRLTADDTQVKNVVEMSLQTSSEYGPGDSFGILAENSDVDVNKLIKRLCLTDSQDLQYTLTSSARIQPKHIINTCSVYYALKYTLDIYSLPKKAMLKYLGEHCALESEGAMMYYLASKDGSDELNRLIYNTKMSLLEILNIVPSCTPPFVGLLQFLPRLMPRYYSVSKYEPGRISFAFTVVDNIRSDSSLQSAEGVCSSWLNSLNVKRKVCIYKRKNEYFRPVLDNIIMIGAGTGVAPFLSFLQHLQHERNSGNYEEFNSQVLITGNRYCDMDSLYSTLLEGYLADRTLSHHYTAYSRDVGAQYHYVQDCIAGNSKFLVNMIDKGASVYVCGDAKGLAKGVEETFVKVLAEEKGICETAAKDQLKSLREKKLYLEDIW